MTLDEIIEKAISQNVDCDSYGNVTGYDYATEQIKRDMATRGYRILNPSELDDITAMRFTRAIDLLVSDARAKAAIMNSVLGNAT